MAVFSSRSTLRRVLVGILAAAFVCGWFYSCTHRLSEEEERQYCIQNIQVLTIALVNWRAELVGMENAGGNRDFPASIADLAFMFPDGKPPTKCPSGALYEFDHEHGVIVCPLAGDKKHTPGYSFEN